MIILEIIIEYKNILLKNLTSKDTNLDLYMTFSDKL
jgi:hypothetical protein